MIGRLVEDAYILGRFAWFYSQAPKRMNSVGFARTSPLTRKERAKWAWQMTSGKI